MMNVATSPSEHGEEARAFLQARLVLYWKVLCAFMVIGTALGLHGAFKRWGADLILDAALAAEAGLLWAICRRGAPSVRALRVLEGIGLIVYFLYGYRHSNVARGIVDVPELAAEAPGSIGVAPMPHAPAPPQDIGEGD